jgi:GxxExxY protein
MEENKISYDVRGAIYRVYNELGPGLLESVYETALIFELRELGYTIQNQVGIPMNYRNIKCDVGFRMDILVNNCVVIEIKSVEALQDIHHKQLLTYLKLSGNKLGILVNFNTMSINSNIVRIVNNL